MIFYFSGVGNSVWVAKQLAAEMNDTLVSIADYADEEYNIEPHERVGFVFPVYSWAPPKVVMDFIARVKMNTPAYLYFVCTCGAEAGKTMEVFTQAVEARGWHCFAGYSIVMPNTYVSFPGFGIDTAAVAQQKIANAKNRISEILESLMQNMQTDSCYEGPLARFKTYTINPFFNKYQLSSKPFFATDACINCGRCAQVCPVHNILIKNDKPHWDDRCTQCMACFHACPTNAVQYGRFTKGKKQYKIADFL